MSRITATEAQLKVMQENIASKNKAQLFVSKNKYGNRKTVIDGITFDSKKESQRYLELKMLERAGKIFELRTQVKYPLTVNGVKIGNYISDFSYILNNEIVVEDVKSKPTITAIYKWKRKHFKIEYGISIKEVL